MKRLFTYILMPVCVAGMVELARAQETNETNAASAPVPAATAPSPASNALDLNSFKIISSRNIFNPNRSGKRPSYISRSRRTVRNDSFTLVGTMSYEKGAFAIFNGNRSEYKKALKPNDKIAGYTIAEIEPNGIKLAASSNQIINFPIGTQMRKPEGGRWSLVGAADTTAEAAPELTPTATTAPAPVGASSDSTTTDAAPSAAQSEIMKRLMEKRLKEQ